MTEPDVSVITIPVTIIDLAGRKMTVQAPSNTHHVTIGVGPMGAFLFDKTDEIDPETLQRVYRQRE